VSLPQQRYRGIRFRSFKGGYVKDLTIIVGTIGQSILRSEDNGQTWTRIGPRRGFPYEASVRCIVMRPTEPNVVFAGMERGLYRSEDAGANWRCMDSVLNSYYVWALCIDPANPNVMFAGTGTPSPARIFCSTDGGTSWERRPAEIAATCENVGSPRVTAIAIDPLESENVWMGLEVDGARHSTDGGNTWELVEVTGHKDIHNVVVTAGPPKTVFVVANREIYATADNGVNWTSLGMQTNIPWEYPRKETYLRGVAAYPADPKTLLLGFGDFTPGTSGGVARSDDLGNRWELLPLPVEPNSTVWTFGTNAVDPNIVFAATRYGYLYRSDSGGASWTKLRREFSEIAAVCWLPN
jgi:photosystem II stability/assembly factor-like uncharacterized protein